MIGSSKLLSVSDEDFAQYVREYVMIQLREGNNPEELIEKLANRFDKSMVLVGNPGHSLEGNSGLIPYLSPLIPIGAFAILIFLFRSRKFGKRM